MSFVRRADTSDVPWLLEQLREFATFFGSKRTLFPDDATARAILHRLMVEHVFLIAQHDVRTGFIAGTIGPHPFNPGICVLTELFWWVLPQYRGTAVGARLLLEFEAIGRRECDWVVMSLEEKTITERLIDPSSLERRGFRPQERSYLLEVTARAST